MLLHNAAFLGFCTISLKLYPAAQQLGRAQGTSGIICHVGLITWLHSGIHAADALELGITVLWIKCGHLARRSEDCTLGDDAEPL